MYYCNACDTEIDDDDIKYDADVELDYCPHCESADVDYFPCEASSKKADE